MIRIRHCFIVLGLLAAISSCNSSDVKRCECEAGAAPEAPRATPILETDKELYTLPGLDHGLVQSPVNILSGGAVHGRHQVALHYDHTAPEYIINKGTTIELDFPTGGGSITYDSKEFELVQLHFHTPSEHLVDGVTYPMSMHIVNRMTEEHSDGRPHYLVIAILFKMGAANDFIGSFLEAVPLDPGTSAHIDPGAVYLDDLFPDHKMPHYFHYRGSLTTPPHTETVDWLVLKHVKEASPEQIQRINEIEGDNARHVQALYGRPIDD